jgi:hypothetical protein
MHGRGNNPEAAHEVRNAGAAQPITSALPALARAWGTFWRSRAGVARLVVTLYVPLEVALQLIEVALKGASADQSGMLALGARFVAYGVVGALAAPSLIGVYHAERCAGEKLSVRSALSFGAARWVRTLVFRAQSGVYVLGGTLLLVLPGIILMVMGLLVDPVAALEPRTRGVWSRSRSLTKGMRMPAGAAFAFVVIAQTFASLALLIVLNHGVEKITGVQVAAAPSLAGGASVFAQGPTAAVLVAATKIISQFVQQLLGALAVALTFELYLAALAPRADAPRAGVLNFARRALALRARGRSGRGVPTGDLKPYA